MTIDFSARHWKLKRSLAFNSFTARSPKSMGLPMSGRLLRVEASFPSAKLNWIKAGSLFQIYRGLTPPSGTVIAFGQQFVTMSNLTPYTLLFRPVSWLPNGSLRIWEYIPTLTDRDLLDLSVHQDGSILSTITQLFTEIMSTDIRAQKKAIEDTLAAAQAAQSSANTAQGAADTVAASLQNAVGTIQTISTEMVRKFTSNPLSSNDFYLFTENGYFYATVNHGLNDSTPDIEVYDNDKEKQSIQSMVVDSNTIKLELSANEMATNSFPLICICVGKSSPD